jgi:filamentous hemagglutinin family protein
MSSFFQHRSLPYFWLAGSFCLCFLGTTRLARAQITPDTTLPNNTSVIPNGNSSIIEGGTQVGGTLFHSFQEFSIRTGSQALFNNGADIQNILSRVTGGNVSNIDGLIGANGTANLFVINPNGLVFGPNAQLNIGGSFIGATANGIKLADGSVFSATSPQAPPLLTINVPLGLQFGSNPGAIRVEGRGNSGVFPINNTGLAVSPGRTLALVGGDVTLIGGILTAPSGRIEMGSVANGEVNLTPIATGWRLGYDQIQAFRTIQLLSQSSLWNPNSSSNSQGGIQVQGGRVVLNERSQIAALTQGSLPGADITINAARSLDIGGGVDNVLPFASWVVNQVAQGASGQGGQITVTTPVLRMQDGGRIQTQSFGAGLAGNVTVKADESILVHGFSRVGNSPSQAGQNLNSRISSENFAAGAGGNVSVSTRQLTLLNGGQVGTVVGPLATGAGGTVTVNVTDAIAATNGNPLNPFLTSAIVSQSLGAGQGGDIAVTTRQLTLSDGALIQSLAQGTGKGGNATVKASESIAAIGVNPFIPSVAGGILARTGGPADGGNIRVSTERLTIQAGAVVSSSVFDPGLGALIAGAATGNAGDVMVNADQLEIVGANLLSPFNASPSALGSATFGAGNAGDVSVSTRQLTLKDGGSLTSIVFPAVSLLGQILPGTGTGNGGNLTVNASESISVVGVAPATLTPSILGTSTATSGNAGNTLIHTRQLVVRDGGQVNSSTRATGAAGQITINASESIWVSGTALNGTPAEVSANALIANPALRRSLSLPAIPTGNTGELTIYTGRLTVRDGGRVSVLHEGSGNAGKLQLYARSVLLDRGGRISADTLLGFGGDVNLNVQSLLLLRNGSAIAVEAKGGNGNGGNLAIDSGFVVAIPQENSDITANAVGGNGGNIRIRSDGIYGLRFRPRVTPLSDITASSEFGLDGSIEVKTLKVDPSNALTTLPENVSDHSDRIVTDCAANDKNSFVITGRGGLPEDPTGTLRGRTIWRDLRPPGQASGAVSKSEDEFSIANSPPPLVEAQTWVINAQGQVELVADASGGTPHSSWHKPTECRKTSPN